jgi:lipopolysaccharide export system permease protein
MREVRVRDRRLGRKRGRLRRMGSIGRYIFRTTFGAFLLVLIVLTGIIWITQALRELDLMTSQGQTILVFFGITGLIIPLLILLIAPIALVLAVTYVLHKLGSDSEIIVMNGAGMRPWRVFQPFLTAAIVVSLLVAAISAYIAPEGLRMLRRWLTEVRADLVSNIVQPGRFLLIERGLTFHIRERRANGLLTGLLLDDRRDPKERVTIIAERGEILKNAQGNFLVLESGSIQRLDPKQRDPNIVMFERYAVDLSQVEFGSKVIQYSARERNLWQLISPDPNDPKYRDQKGQFRAEFHDRILAPVYPLVFVVIAYAFMGTPRTTRQSRAWSMVGIALSVSMLRLIGYCSTVFGISYPFALTWQYIALAGALAYGLYAISRGLVIEPPAMLFNTVNAAVEWFSRQTGAIAGRTP